MSAAPTGSNLAAALPTRVGRAADLGGRFRVEIVCFPFVVAAYAAHLFLSGYDRFYYDSSVYWQLGHSFHYNGHFSLVGFQEGVPTYPRGYSLPLLNHFLQVIASAGGLGSVTIVKIFGALLAATLGVIVAPRLARQLFPCASIDVGRCSRSMRCFSLLAGPFRLPALGFPGSAGGERRAARAAPREPSRLSRCRRRFRSRGQHASRVSACVAGGAPRRGAAADTAVELASARTAAALVLAGAFVAFCRR